MTAPSQHGIALVAGEAGAQRRPCEAREAQEASESAAAIRNGPVPPLGRIGRGRILPVLTRPSA